MRNIKQKKGEGKGGELSYCSITGHWLNGSSLIVTYFINKSIAKFQFNSNLQNFLLN